MSYSRFHLFCGKPWVHRRTFCIVGTISNTVVPCNGAIPAQRKQDGKQILLSNIFRCTICVANTSGSSLVPKAHYAHFIWSGSCFVNWAKCFLYLYSKTSDFPELIGWGLNEADFGFIQRKPSYNQKNLKKEQGTVWQEWRRRDLNKRCREGWGMD